MLGLPFAVRPSLQAANVTPLEERVRSRRDFDEIKDETAKGGQINAPLAFSLAPMIVSWAKAGSDDQTTDGPAAVKTLVTLITAEDVNGCTTIPVAPHWTAPAVLNFWAEIPSLVKGPGSCSSQKR